MSGIDVKENCTGCGICVRACPFAAIQLVDGKAKINEACTLCGVCARSCPVGAILIERPAISTEHFKEYKGVWVVAEQDDSKLKSVSLELVSEGRRLADELHEELHAILVGCNISELARQLSAQGAEKIYLVEHEVLKCYTTDAYTDVISGLINRHKPSIVLFGATANGRDLAPRVAARVRVGLTADCTGLSIDKERRLVQTRPAFGGNIMASIISHTRPQMATVRPRVMKIAKPDETRKSATEQVSVNLSPLNLRTRVIEQIKEITKPSEKIEEAEIIVSCGRGIGKKEEIKLVSELAEALGAAVGGSRPLIDCGWLPHQQQVGQSGKTVAPKLYIAVGISGTIQHRIGMQSSNVIIAINKDPEAPIFNLADLGVVGDLYEIVPKIKEELRKLPNR